MTNIISIYKLSGVFFQEIKYDNINELNENLITLITSYDADIHIQLLINDNILNNYDIIEFNILTNISK